MARVNTIVFAENTIVMLNIMCTVGGMLFRRVTPATVNTSAKTREHDQGLYVERDIWLIVRISAKISPVV